MKQHRMIGIRLRCIIAIVSFGYVAMFLLVLPVLCRTWVYSVYFSLNKNSPELVQRVLKENDERLTVSTTYLERFASSNIQKLHYDVYPDSPVDLAIGVITLKREDQRTGQLGYLTQTTARLLSVLLQGQKSYEFRNVKTFLCNVDPNPLWHKEASKVVSFFDGHTERYTSNTTDNGHNKPLGYEAFEKGKTDYVFCLNHGAREYQPKYVMLLEDDVILDHDSLYTVAHLIRTRLVDSERFSNDGLLRWIFVKLYYPQRWNGYGFEADKVAEIIGLAIIGGSIALCLFAVTLGRFYKSSHTLATSFTIHAVGALTLAGTAYLIGRPYINSWRSISPYTHRLISAPDCCTQAVLYPAAIIPDLIEYLKTVHCDVDFAVDLAIDRFASMRDLSRHLVEPNVARHIGFISTVRGKYAAEFL